MSVVVRAFLASGAVVDFTEDDLAIGSSKLQKKVLRVEFFRKPEKDCRKLETCLAIDSPRAKPASIDLKSGKLTVDAPIVCWIWERDGVAARTNEIAFELSGQALYDGRDLLFASIRRGPDETPPAPPNPPEAPKNLEWWRERLSGEREIVFSEGAKNRKPISPPQCKVKYGNKGVRFRLWESEEPGRFCMGWRVGLASLEEIETPVGRQEVKSADDPRILWTQFLEDLDPCQSVSGRSAADLPWLLTVTGLATGFAFSLWNYVVSGHAGGLALASGASDLSVIPQLAPPADSTLTGQEAEELPQPGMLRMIVDPTAWEKAPPVHSLSLRRAVKASLRFVGLHDRDMEDRVHEVGAVVTSVPRYKRTAALLELVASPAVDGSRDSWLRIGALDIQLSPRLDAEATFKLWVEGFALRVPELPVQITATSAHTAFPVLRVVAGGEDAVPDSQRADRSEARSEALVFAPVEGANQLPLVLDALEEAKPERDRSLRLTLKRAAAAQPIAAKPEPLVYLNREPFLVAQVTPDLPIAEADADFDEVGNWSLSELEGNRWELAAAGRPFHLTLPPQAIGEAMEKNTEASSSIAADEPIDYRFGSVATAKLRSSYFQQRFAEAPWNLQRVLGYPGQRAPGARVDTLDFELVYGLNGSLSSDGAEEALHLAEIGARLGALADSIETSRRSAGGKTAADRVLDDYAALWDELRGAYRSRLAVLELYAPGRLLTREERERGVATTDLVLTKGVSFRRRKGANLADPINPSSTPDLLQGGVTWPFESRNVLDTVKGVSSSGRVSRLYLSSLGGWGEQRAGFDNNRTLITSTTLMGRLSRMTVERVGRIGVLWHRAKHVIVYERTTLPSEQFESSQHTLRGRPIVRKVAEYVELLQPTRSYPDFGNATLPRGCVERAQFTSVRIPVDGAWGRDVPGGFEIPLWREDADPRIYPKPQVQVVTAGDKQGVSEQVGTPIERPERLYFYSATDPSLDDRSDAWPAVAGVDFADEPPPQPEREDPIDAAAPDALLPDALVDEPGFERFSWPLSEPAHASNLVAERSAEPMSARLFAVSMMRGDARPASSSPLASGLEAVAEVRQTLERARSSLAGAMADAASFDAQAKQRLAREAERVAKRVEKIAAPLRDARNLVSSAGADLAAWNPCDRLFDHAEASITAQVGQKQRLLREWKQTIDAEFGRYGDQISEAVLRERIGDWTSQLNVLITPLRVGIEDAIEAVGAVADRAERRYEDSLAEFDAISAPITSGLIRQDLAVALLTDLAESVAAGVTRFLETLPSRLPAPAQAVVEKARAALLRSLTSGGFADAVGEKAASLIREVGEGPYWIEDLSDGVEEFRAAVFGDPEADEPAGLAGPVQLLRDAHESLAITAGAIAPAELDGWASTVHGILEDAIQAGQTPRHVVKAALDSAFAEVDALAAKALAAASQQGLAPLRAHFCGDGAFAWAKTTQAKLEEGLKGLEANAQGLSKGIREIVEDGAQGVAKARAQIEAALGPALEAAEQAQSQVRSALADLGKSPTFRDPSSTLRLVRAVGEGPLLPQLKFNRNRIAYFFDDYAAAVRTSPMAALVDRVGDDLKAFGLRVPTQSLLDRIVPASLQNFDLGTVLPDFAGLRNSALFKGVKLPAVANDQVKVNHGIDKANQTAWLRARVDVPLAGATKVFSLGPLALDLLGARFEAHSELIAAPGKGLRKRAEGSIVGDWRVRVGGAPIVTFAETRLRFDDAGRLDFDIRADRVVLDRALKWLADLIKKYKTLSGDENSGFTLELMEWNGLPIGVRCTLDLPLPPITGGAFSITGLQLGAALEVGIDPFTRDFGITLAFNLGRRSEPFTLTIAFLGGGGWLETRARYIPSRDTLSTDLSIGVVAGAGAELALGPIRGGIYLQFGIFVELHKQGDRPTSLAIGIMLLLRGHVVVLGFVHVSLVLMLLAVYQAGRLTGTGTLCIKVRISRFFKVTVKKQVKYRLAGSGAKTAVAAPNDNAVLALRAAEKRAAAVE